MEVQALPHDAISQDRSIVLQMSAFTDHSRGDYIPVYPETFCHSHHLIAAGLGFPKFPSSLGWPIHDDVSHASRNIGG